MDAPENAIEYYAINTTKPPMDDVRVRKAFNMAIDKEALADFRVVVKPLTAFTPEGIFPGYPQPKGDAVRRRARPRAARRGRVSRRPTATTTQPKFPSARSRFSTTRTKSNRQIAEFIQAQWKQNLGITVPLRNMEFRTFLVERIGARIQGLRAVGLGRRLHGPVHVPRALRPRRAATTAPAGWTRSTSRCSKKPTARSTR